MKQNKYENIIKNKVAPSRVRELKLDEAEIEKKRRKVAPSRVRELKQIISEVVVLDKVAPSRVRELKLTDRENVSSKMQSHLHGCVN